jgi:hypothetical protein
LKKEVHKLSLNHDDDSVLIGLVCQEADYRLAFALNKEININLTQSENIEIPIKNSAHKKSFSVFHAEDSRNVTYKLISNHCESRFLLNEYRNMDYFLFIPGGLKGEMYDLLIRKIRNIKFIPAIFILDITTLKNPQVLMF